MRRELGICVVLTVTTILVYGQVASFDFVNFDDLNYIVENPHVSSGISARNIGWAFTAGYEANWHPVTWLSLMLDAQIFGLKPAGYHLINLLFHVLDTLLLFWVLRAMTLATWRSAFVAALFALHPLHVESVAWITERKDVLSLFWGLLSLWAYAAYAQRGGWGRYTLSALCLALGLMAKPLLITLPFLFLLLDYWPLDRIAGHGIAQPAGGKRRADHGGSSAAARKPAFVPRTLGHLLLEKVPFLALVVASSVATYLAQSRQGAVSDTAAVSLGLRLGNAAVSYVRYLGKMLWPRDLSILYPHPNMPGGTPWAAWQVIGSMLLLLAISWLVFRFRRFRFLTVGWLWYLGALVPMIGIVQVGTQAMADRYTYLPLIGLFIAIAWSSELLVSHERGGGRARARDRKGRGSAAGAGAVVVPAAVLVLVLCAGITRGQVRVWRNSVTLGLHAITAGPTGPKIHYNLGLALSQAGRFNEAIPHYQDAIRLKPDHAKAYNNLGRSLQKLGRLDEAITSIRRAIQIDPDLELAYINLSDALVAANRLDEAIAARQQAARLNPFNAVNINNLGGLLASTGRYDAAIAHFRRALELQPDFQDARRNLQMALEQKAQANAGP
jgi:Tfp pilus assembly protein PilF